MTDVASAGGSQEVFTTAFQNRKKAAGEEGGAKPSKDQFDPDDTQSQLKSLMDKAAQLREDLKELQKKSRDAQNTAARDGKEGHDLEKKSIEARGECHKASQEVARANAEAQTEEGHAQDAQANAEYKQQCGEAEQREADLLRTQGERMLAAAPDLGAGRDDAIEYLNMANSRSRQSQSTLTEAGRFRQDSSNYRNAGVQARQRQKDAQADAADADKRASDLSGQAREKQNSAGEARSEAMSLQGQAADTELELALLEKDMDELIEMANALPIILVIN